MSARVIKSVSYGLNLERDSEVLVLAEGSEPTDWRIQFDFHVGELNGRPLEFVVETYSASLNGAEFVFGCVSSLVITPTTIRLAFAPEAAAALGVDEELELSLDVTNEELRLLVVGARSILGDGFAPTDIKILG